MTEKDPVELFLSSKKDIDSLREKTEELMREDLGLSHKMDRLSDAFKRMEEGFSHSRETGFKTFEAVQKMSGQIGEIEQGLKSQNMRMDHHDERIKEAFEKANEAFREQKWLTRALILSVASGIILAALVWGISKILGP